VKNVRLNARMRRVILDRLLHHAFQAAREALAGEREALAAEVYDDVYPADVQRKMRRLPEGFLETSAQICVNMGGQSVSFSVEDRPVAHKHHYFSTPAGSYPADHPFTLRHNDLHARFQKLDEESSRSRHVGEAALESCATLRQIVEEWPEAEPFVRDFLEAQSSQSVALAVPVRELNRQFNLGAGARVAAPRHPVRGES
jgi:hypothetical protein